MRRPSPWYVGLALVAWPGLVCLAYAIGWLVAVATTTPSPTAQEAKNIGTIR